MPRRTSESAEDICDVCSEAVTIFAVGKCDHPVCFKCSTRLRALIDDMTCPICRTDLPKVVFTKTKKLFEKILWQKFKLNRKHAIYFEDASIEKSYTELLEHQCQLCPDRTPERQFKQLRTHMSKEHSLHYCDICVEHLKVFSSERRYYSRPDLAHHKRVGDTDDTSHRGHPLCEFCDVRYLDNDELLRHLRKEHYFCHFCDQHGSNQYYSDYEVLREHFLDKHYLCEEGDCVKAQFTNAFNSSIDLKAHLAHHHAGGVKKSQMKLNRTLDIEINLAPREYKSNRKERSVVTGDDYEDVGRGRGRGRGYRRSRREDDDDDYLKKGIAASLAHGEKPESGAAAPESDPVTPDVASTDDFPTIGTASSVPAPAAAVSSTMANKFARENNTSVKESTEDDFPELPSSRELQQHAKKVPVHPHKVWRFDHKPAPSSGDDKHISRKKFAGMDFQVPKEAQIKEEEDFPALSGANKTEPNKPVSEPLRKSVHDPVSKPDLPFKHPPLSSIAAKAPKSTNNEPTLSSIGNVLISGESRGNVSSFVKPRTYVSSGNMPNLTSDSDFPSLGGGYQAVEADSWVASPPRQSSPSSKIQNKAEPAHTTKQTMQNSHANVLDDNEDFPSLGEGGTQVQPMWVTKGAPSNRIKQKPITVSKPVSNSSHKPQTTTNVQKKNAPLPSNLEGLLETHESGLPEKKTPLHTADEEEFITVVGKPKKKPDSEASVEAKQGKKKKKKKKKGKTNKECEEEEKENADDMVISYALAALEEADKKPPEPEIDLVGDFRMGGELKTKPNKSKSQKDKKRVEKTATVPEKSHTDTRIEVEEELEVKKVNEVDHVKVISNKNLSNVEKLAHMNNFSLLEEVEDVPAAEMPSPPSKGHKKNNKVPDLDSDEFPVLGGGAQQHATWMEAPRDYTSAKSQKKLTESTPFTVTKPEASVPKSILQLQSSDFPSLESDVKYSSRSPTVSPPGISVSDYKPFKPPPGFVSGGSLSAIASSLEGVHILPSNEQKTMKPAKMTYMYAQPPDFQERNHKLIMEFHNLLRSEQEFDEFKFLSGQFRQGISTAQDYFTSCVSLMGIERFMVVFPELLVLLPDIGKQKELHEAFKTCKKNSFMKKQSLHVQTCSSCQQVLTQKDFGYHVCIPDLTQDFSSL